MWCRSSALTVILENKIMEEAELNLFSTLAEDTLKTALWKRFNSTEDAPSPAFQSLRREGCTDSAASVTDEAIQQLLQQEISSNAAFPQPSPNTLYFVFLPSGTTVVQGGSSSCQQFCGYHDAIGDRIFYAVMPFPDCPGCLGGVAQLDTLTSTTSHELCEAITDPIPGQGWYDDINGEIGDICAWKSKQLGKYAAQLEWSNQSDKCV
jgi:hypothetical protein